MITGWGVAESVNIIINYGMVFRQMEKNIDSRLGKCWRSSWFFLAQMGVKIVE
jgi:hypothetical protein